MQAINFSTLFPSQDAVTSQPQVSTHTSAMAQNTVTSTSTVTVGQQLSSLLQLDNASVRVRALASRFAREGVSASSLTQLSSLLEQVPVRQYPALSGTLRQVTEQQPALESHVQALQGAMQQAQSQTLTKQDALGQSVKAASVSRGDFRALVVPASFTPVPAQQAERSIQTVMNAPLLSASGLMGMNIEALALQAANLGIKTFSDTASAVTKSQTIATEARKNMMDKQVEDFSKDLEKAIKQQENAKKGGIFGAILKWVMPVISVVAMVFVPMSLPLMVGMIGATVASTASAAMNTAQLIMGPNAPGWLQKMNNIMDWVSTTLGFVVGASAMWLGEKIANGIIHGLELLTQVAEGVNNGVTGILNTKLQKEINELELNMDWREALIDLFKKATQDNSRRLEKATDAWSTGNQKLIDVMSENATLRARIAKSMV